MEEYGDLDMVNTENTNNTNEEVMLFFLFFYSINLYPLASIYLFIYFYRNPNCENKNW